MIKDLAFYIATTIYAISNCLKLNEVMNEELVKRIDFARQHQLKVLDLSGLQLNYIPHEITQLTQLEKLWLNNNKIKQINSLSELNNLRELYLPNNEVEDLSPIKELHMLTHLGIAGNKIQSLDALKELTLLESLLCERNSIEALNPVESLKELKILFVCENRIKDLSSLSDLPNLEVIQAFGNPIRNFGKVRCHLRVSIRGKKIELPPEITNQGNEAIKVYIKSLDEGVRPLNEVKVILIGNGASGKTSLIKKFRQMPFNPHEKQTHGIKIHRDTVSVRNELITLHFWDFGGQEIMHATHQFFLTNRSIYLIVVDSRKDEKIEYWLKHVETFGGNSPVIIAINKIDENPGFDLNRRFLSEKYKNISAFYRISCLSNEGIDRLYSYIVDSAYKMETRKILFSPNWFNVKEHIDRENGDYISYDHYRKICTENSVEVRTDQNVLLEYLNSLGIILHFEKLKLYDTQVLNPRWLTNAVYQIINSNEIAKNSGYFTVDLISEILCNSYRSDQEFIYPESKVIFIIKIMQKFELCYSLKGLDECFIIPDLLPVEEPRFDYKTFPLRFVIKYDFLPPTIIPRFIVQMHDRIQNKLCWRTGIVIYEPLFDSTAFVKVDREEKEVQIWLKGSRRRDLLSFIRRVIHEINNTYINIDYKELVPLPDDENYFIEYEELIGYEEANREEYFIGKKRVGYQVSDLLNGIENPKNRSNTSTLDVFIAYSEEDKKYKESFKKHLKPLSSIKLWDMDSLLPGEPIKKIYFYIEKANFIFALLSSDFISSSLFESLEFEKAFKQGKIIPVLVRPVDFQSSQLSSLQPLPRSGYIGDPKNDDLWLSIIKEIETVLDEYQI